MSNPKHDAKSYKVICVILVIIVLLMAYGWYRCEEKKVELYDEIQILEEKIERMKEGERYE